MAVPLPEGRLRLRASIAAVRRKAEDPAEGQARANGVDARRYEAGLGPPPCPIGRVSEAASVPAQRGSVPPAAAATSAAANRTGGPSPPARIGSAQAGSVPGRPVGARPLGEASAFLVTATLARVMQSSVTTIVEATTTTRVKIGPRATRGPLSGSTVVGTTP